MKESEFVKMETRSFDKIYLQSTIKMDHWFETYNQRSRFARIVL